MEKRFDLIGFDADDTLWHNEPIYTKAQDEFARLLESYSSREDIQRRLFETESRNIAFFGYGIKSFTLSMIETAIQLTGGRIVGTDVQKIIDLGCEMLQAEVQLLDGVRETVARLAESYPLMIVTKGDLLDQEAKVARSGIGDYFSAVEVVSGKTGETYAALLAKHQVEPGRFLMVGNSLKSDILPVVEIGGRGVYVPYAETWAHELVENPGEANGWVEIANLRELPDRIEKIE